MLLTIILFPFLPSIYHVQTGWFGKFSSISTAGVGTPHKFPSNNKEWLHCCFPKHAKRTKGGRTYAKAAPTILSLANSQAECFPSALQECQIINYYSTFCAGKQSRKQCLESPPSPDWFPQQHKPNSPSHAPLNPFLGPVSNEICEIQGTAGTGSPPAPGDSQAAPQHCTASLIIHLSRNTKPSTRSKRETKVVKKKKTNGNGKK